MGANLLILQFCMIIIQSIDTIWSGRSDRVSFLMEMLWSSSLRGVAFGHPLFTSKLILGIQFGCQYSNVRGNLLRERISLANIKQRDEQVMPFHDWFSSSILHNCTPSILISVWTCTDYKWKHYTASCSWDMSFIEPSLLDCIWPRYHWFHHQS